jgi:hypothetical protein
VWRRRRAAAAGEGGASGGRAAGGRLAGGWRAAGGRDRRAAREAAAQGGSRAAHLVEADGPEAGLQDVRDRDDGHGVLGADVLAGRPLPVDVQRSCHRARAIGRASASLARRRDHDRSVRGDRRGRAAGRGLRNLSSRRGRGAVCVRFAPVGAERRLGGWAKTTWRRANSTRKGTRIFGHIIGHHLHDPASSRDGAKGRACSRNICLPLEFAAAPTRPARTFRVLNIPQLVEG